MSMKGLKATSEKGKGSNRPVRYTTPAGKPVRVPGGTGPEGSGRKSSGLSKEAARGLGVKR